MLTVVFHVCLKTGGKASIPGDRQSVADIGEIDIIKYTAPENDASSKAGSVKSASQKSGSKSGSAKRSESKAASEKAPSEKSPSEKGRSQPPSILGESVVEEKSSKRSVVSFADEVETPVDEFQQAVEQLEDKRSKAGSTVDQVKSEIEHDLVKVICQLLIR